MVGRRFIAAPAFGFLSLSAFPAGAVIAAISVEICAATRARAGDVVKPAHRVRAAAARIDGIRDRIDKLRRQFIDETGSA